MHNTNDTNDAPTRPEKRSTICVNTSNTSKRLKNRSPVYGNTDNINDTPIRPETLTIQIIHLKDTRTSHLCVWKHQQHK